MELAELLLLVACAVGYLCGAYANALLGGGTVLALLAALLLLVGGSAVPFVLATVAPWAAGRIVRSRRRMVAELQARTRDLTAEQDAFTRLSVRRERARIARELHDIVAHHLAVIVIQAGAGRMGSQGPQEDTARLDSISLSGSEALAELDRLVDLLQPDDVARAPEPGRLSRLLDQVEVTGLRVRATPLAADVQLPTEVEDVAYRLVQEGLTNAIKHAPGSEVRLRLGVADDALEVELHDSGAKAPSSLRGSGSGLGLAGMRERVEALGGTLVAGPSGAGWRLHARIPSGAPPLSRTSTE